MILDKETELATTVALDLDTVRPGPGKPIIMFASGMPAATAVIITDCDTVGGTYASVVEVVTDASGTAEFRLPSSTRQFIKSTFAAGAINVVMEGNQTNL